MHYLEKFGIDHESARPNRVISPEEFGVTDAFFEGSSELLEDITPTVIEHVIPNLVKYRARHSTGGFAVVSLGEHALGTVRMHIWPEDMPRISPLGPSIHSHAFHLSSRIIKGTYIDTIYDVESVSSSNIKPNSDEARLPNLYTSGVDDRGNTVLVTDGSRARATAITERRRAAGEGHTMLAGEYHLPAIPSNQTAVTIVVMSPDVNETINVVLPPEMVSGVDDVSNHRKPYDSAGMLALQHLLNLA